MSTEYHRVTPVSLPPESGVANVYPSVNLADAYSIELPIGASTNPEVLANFIFSQQAPWIGSLMTVRDALVAGFGLIEAAQSDPAHLTTEVRKDKRRSRIFVDTARNAYAQTAAPAYAVRPRDRAPVATPLEWKELDSHQLRPDLYDIRNIFDRLNKIGDPWNGLKQHAQGLPRGRGSNGAR